MRSCSDASSSLRNRRSTASFLGSRFATGVRSEPPLPALLPCCPCGCHTQQCGSQTSPVLHRAPRRRALARRRVFLSRDANCAASRTGSETEITTRSASQAVSLGRRRGARSWGRKAAARFALNHILRRESLNAITEPPCKAGKNSAGSDARSAWWPGRLARVFFARAPARLGHAEPITTTRAMAQAWSGAARERASPASTRARRERPLRAFATAAGAAGAVG